MDDTRLTTRVAALTSLAFALFSLGPGLDDLVMFLVAAGVGVSLPAITPISVSTHNRILAVASLALVLSILMDGAVWSPLVAGAAIAGLIVNQSHDVFSPPATAVGLLLSVLFGQVAQFTVMAGVAFAVVLLIGEYGMSPLLTRLRRLGDLRARSLTWAPLSVVAIAAAVLLALVAEPFFPSVDYEPPISWDGGSAGGRSLNQHPGLNGRLDAGDSLTLDDDIVLRVRSDRPLYWRGMTYDTYDGRFWRDFSDPRPVRMPGGGVRLAPALTAPNAIEVRQIFTVTKAGLDVLVGADLMTEVYFDQVDAQWGLADNSLRLDQPLQAGAQWTVVSSVLPVTADQLRASDRNVGGVPQHILDAYAVEDDISAGTIDLAARITADAPTTYDKVIALEAWFDANVEYTRLIPDAPGGVDPVDRLLFDVQKGYCEQISTSMIVMLRSLGIPARMAVGFVPNELDSSTGEWISRGSDAHAWAEVYFPGIGWQAFDPTAGVPLAGEDREESETTREIPLDLVVLGVAGLGLVALAGVGVSSALDRRTRQRPAALRRLNSIGARLKIDWTDSQTLRDRLADLETVGVDPEVVGRVRVAIETAAFGASDVNQAEIDAALDELAAAVEARRSELVGA